LRTTILLSPRYAAHDASDGRWCDRSPSPPPRWPTGVILQQHGSSGLNGLRRELIHQSVRQPSPQIEVEFQLQQLQARRNGQVRMDVSENPRGIEPEMVRGLRVLVTHHPHHRIRSDLRKGLVALLVQDFNRKDNSMISLASKRAVAPWLPMSFCVALSGITICSNHWLTMANHSDYGSWAIGFLSFLPMCFFFVGTGMSDMRREISELRKQVAELRQHNDETRNDAQS
jgi:hypothetical protein